MSFPERDWKHLFRLKPLALDRLCWRILDEALAAAREIRDEKRRAEALTGLAPTCRRNSRRRSWPRTWPRRGRFGMQSTGRVPWPPWPSRLAERERPALYPLWAETLLLLAGRARKDLLSDLRALAPVIARLGGAGAVAETSHAIEDV